MRLAGCMVACGYDGVCEGGQNGSKVSGLTGCGPCSDAKTAAALP